MVLHELAHGWFGNSVTCKNWQDFWLNEGLAVFIERKMAEKLVGGTLAAMESI
jgi:aminopeptidase N